MAIAIRTVSINAAFLQEIKDDHHELRQLMHHTAAMFDRMNVADQDQPRLTDMLTKLRDQLGMHFTLEEAYGYFEDAIDTAPHLTRRAEKLRAEHGLLFNDLCRLVDAAEKLLYHEHHGSALGQLAQDYRRFSDWFQDHESRESELIQAAVNDDIGTGD